MHPLLEQVNNDDIHVVETTINDASHDTQFSHTPEPDSSSLPSTEPMEVDPELANPPDSASPVPLSEHNYTLL